MPIPGIGVVPPSGATYDELTALTRRAYVPNVVVQLYYYSATMMMLLGGAQRSAGGVNQITIPVQGQSMVQGAWVGYSGSFNKPQVTPGVQPAQFTTAYFVVPVPLVLGESLLQSTEAIVPILDVRMNDVYAVTNQQMGSAVFTNNAANPLMPNSLVDAFDDGTNVAQYGGLNRNQAPNSFWKAQYYPGAGAALTRQIMSQYSIRITDAAGGEAPSAFILSPSDYSALSSTFIGTEQINTYANGRGNMSMDANVRSGFPNLIINGIPFFMDHWCPKGTAYAINLKYLAMYLSEDAPFIFSGFYSAIPQNQLAQVGAFICGYNVIDSKPVSGAQITGITGGAW